MSDIPPAAASPWRGPRKPMSTPSVSTWTSRIEAITGISRRSPGPLERSATRPLCSAAAIFASAPLPFVVRSLALGGGKSGERSGQRERTMRVIAAVAVAAAGAILLWADVGWTQEARTSLPDVTVTAPLPPPPRFSSMSGKTRVEEDRWPAIPCDSSRIAGGAGGKCQTGPQIENFMSGMSTGAQPSAASECSIAHHLVTVGIGRLAVEADLLVVDPYKLTASGSFNKFCTVWSGFKDID